MTRRWCGALLAGLVAALIGCASQPEVTAPGPTRDIRLPIRVAVLPFYLDVKPPADPLQRLATQILREQFFNRFSALGYLDLDLAEVDRRLKGANILPEQAAVARSPNRLAAILGVDGLIVGRVKEVSTFKGGVYTDARLGGTIKLISSDGAIVWEAEHTESRKGGLILRGGELLRAIGDLQSQFKDERHVTYLKLAEEFSRKVVATVPQPARNVAESVAPPRIRRVSVQVETKRVLQAGDLIRVVVEGDTEMTGTMNLGLWRSGLPLVEGSRGRYEGAYTIQAGDSASAVPVMVRLTDAFGLSATSQAAGMALTVDAAPPPPPEEVVAEAIAGQGVVVRWRVGAEASGVALYRSCPPGGELILMARITDGASFTDRSGLASAGSCSYQAATYDAHRNLSYPVVAKWR